MQTPGKAMHIQIIGSMQHTCGHAATVEALLLEIRGPKSTSGKSRKIRAVLVVKHNEARRGASTMHVCTARAIRKR